jgi:hypothetical protein
VLERTFAVAPLGGHCAPDADSSLAEARLPNSWPQAEGDIQGCLMGMPTMPGYFVVQGLPERKV